MCCGIARRERGRRECGGMRMMMGDVQMWED
jgi:hypothetical protein